MGDLFLYFGKVARVIGSNPGTGRNLFIALFGPFILLLSLFYLPIDKLDQPSIIMIFLYKEIYAVQV